MTTLADALRPAIAEAIEQALVAAAPPPGATGPTDKAHGLAEDAVEAMRRDPIVQHALNEEPWYRSRVTLGALLSGLAPLLGLFGIALTPDHRDAIVAVILGVGGVVGPLLTLYGRWAAKRPLGA